MFRKWLVAALAVAFLAGGLIGCEPETPGGGGAAIDTAKEAGTATEAGTAEKPDTAKPGTATE